MNRRLRPLAPIVLLVACQAGTPASSSPAFAPPARPSAKPLESPAPSRTPVALASGPDIAVKLVGDRPVIVRGDGPPGHVAVMPAATAVDADGSVVAFLVWFGSAPGDQVVTVARSADGRTWAIDPAPIYSDFGLSLSPPGAIPGAALRTADGSWLLYGWAARPAARTSFFTWRATAGAPEGPWTIAAGEDDVLPPGPAGAWDDQTAAVSAILPVDGRGLVMWYEGQRAGSANRGGIGYASSADGLTWTRFDDPSTDSAGDPTVVAAGDPVLGPGDCGRATAAAALGPQVWRRGDGYLMLFGGNAGPTGEPDVLGATSADGIHWSCTGEVILGAADIPDSGGIHTIQGATLGGEPILLVESLKDDGSEIWLATVRVGP